MFHDLGWYFLSFFEVGLFAAKDGSVHNLEYLFWVNIVEQSLF